MSSGTASHEKTSSSLWLIPLQVVLFGALGFNLFAVAAILIDAWQADHLGKVLGIGFLFLWLLCSGWIVLRTATRNSSVAPADKESRS
jgi:hypothetical protein